MWSNGESSGSRASLKPGIMKKMGAYQVVFYSFSYLRENEVRKRRIKHNNNLTNKETTAL
jgi:hypothetical protein